MTVNELMRLLRMWDGEADVVLKAPGYPFRLYEITYTETDRAREPLYVEKLARKKQARLVLVGDEEAKK